MYDNESATKYQKYIIFFNVRFLEIVQQLEGLSVDDSMYGYVYKAELCLTIVDAIDPRFQEAKPLGDLRRIAMKRMYT